MTMTRRELDAMPCAEPDCDHVGAGHTMYLHPACHPHGGTVAKYVAGEIRIDCKTCGLFVCAVKVAES